LLERRKANLEETDGQSIWLEMDTKEMRRGGSDGEEPERSKRGGEGNTPQREKRVEGRSNYSIAARKTRTKELSFPEPPLGDGPKSTVVGSKTKKESWEGDTNIRSGRGQWEKELSTLG